MTISVITPVYKVSDYIQRCLISLFEQTYSDIEYVFVNDASPDDSINILYRVMALYPERKEQIKIITHETNRGVSAARNTGLSASSGDYIYFVDADDWIEDDAIEQFVNATEDGKVDVVGCGWTLSYENSDRVIALPHIKSSTDCLKALLCGQMRWNLWLFMVKREIYNDYKLTFPENQNFGEDMLVMIQAMSFAKSYSLINYPLYHYVQQNSNSLTKMPIISQIDSLLPNVLAVINHINSHRQDLIGYLDYYKLNVKLPLLISDEIASYIRWNLLFPESHKMILNNRNQSLRIRILQFLAYKECYRLVKAHYRIVYKMLYGIMYV